MNVAPGWYQDPQDPNSARYWDGRAWTNQRMPAGGGPAGGPPSPGAPSGRPMWPWLVLAGLILAVAIGVGVWFATGQPNPFGSASPTPTVSASSDTPTPSADASPTDIDPSPSSEASPSESQTAPPASVDPSQISCEGGNAEYTRNEMPTYSAAGIAYDGVADWGFSFDPSYWTFLNDHSAMGAIRIDGDDDTSAGIALGGLPKTTGFATVDQAVESALRCAAANLTESAPEPELQGAGPIEHLELGGMPAAKMSTQIKGDASTTLLEVYVIDSGLDGQWAALVTFEPPTSSAAPLIDAAIASVRRA